MRPGVIEHRTGVPPAPIDPRRPGRAPRVGRVTASPRIPHAEGRGCEAGRDHAVMAMLCPTASVQQIVAEVHAPREVALMLQGKLLLEAQLLTDVRLLPVLEIGGVRQSLLMDAADLVQIQMLQSRMSLRIGRLPELLQLVAQDTAIFRLQQRVKFVVLRSRRPFFLAAHHTNAAFLVSHFPLRRVQRPPATLEDRQPLHLPVLVQQGVVHQG